MQRAVLATNTSRLKGVVKNVSANGDYGFIGVSSGGNDVFIHASQMPKGAELKMAYQSNSTRDMVKAADHRP